MNPVQIQAAYERDQGSNRPALTAQDLPRSFESISNGWLTAVLCGNTPGAVVLAHRLSEIDNGSSNRRKIYLDYNSAGTQAKLPAAAFCKATHELANRIVLGVSGGARNEALFYNTIRPLLEIEAPVARFASFEGESFNSMIMLDDLTGKVQAFCNHETVMTRQRTESQVRLLAKLHGACFRNSILKQRILEFPTFQQFFDNTLGFGMREGSEAGFAAAEEAIPSRLYRQQDRIWPATLAAVRSGDLLPRTLAHGDVHLKNWYIAASGEMGLSDWQCVARAHWGRDFAYTLATSLTIENRRAWERELLAYYLDQLTLAGGESVDFESAWKIYRQQLIPSLTWWTVTLRPTADLPDMQPREVTIEFIRRIATAMDDLDSLTL